MTRETNQEEMWRALFQEQHARLATAAGMLLFRKQSPEIILRTALAEVEGCPFDEFFGQISALRAVVKAAIAYNYTLIDPNAAFAPPVSVNDGDMEPPLLAALPWPEHAVYFLSEVLHFTRRDIALLLGISDSNVDQLIRFGENRLESWADTFVHSQLPETKALRAADSNVFDGLGVIRTAEESS